MEETNSTPSSAATVLAAEAPTGFWRTFWDAVRGTERDYTQGPVGTAVVLLAVPMVLEMLMEGVFAVVDVFYVGKLGANAVATVGLTESLLMIIYTVAMGLSIGATSTVARRIGEKDKEGAAVAAVQVLALAILISAVLGAVGMAFAPQLLKLMGATTEILAEGVTYCRVMIGCSLVIMLLFLANAILRGAGDAAIAMRALWLANGLNVILCPMFIFGLGPIPALGVTGAAVATTLGRGIGAAYVLRNLVRGSERLRIEARHLRLAPSVMKSITKMSLSGTLQIFIGSASWIGLTRIMAGFGPEALAANVIAMRIILFALFPAFGFSNAAATMVGQSLGSGQAARAERAVWVSGFYNMCFLGFVGLIFLAFSSQIVAQFTTDTTVLSLATQGLRIIACGYPFYAYGMVLTQAFNGAGDTWTPTVLNFLIFWLFEIPLGYVLATQLDFGPVGVFVAVLASFSILAPVSAVVFRRGRWKTRRV